MQFVVFLLLIVAGAIVLALYVGYVAASGLFAATVALAAYSVALPAGYLAALGQVLVFRPAGLLPPERWPSRPKVTTQPCCSTSMGQPWPTAGTR